MYFHSSAFTSLSDDVEYISSISALYFPTTKCLFTWAEYCEDFTQIVIFDKSVRKSIFLKRATLKQQKCESHLQYHQKLCKIRSLGGTEGPDLRAISYSWWPFEPLALRPDDPCKGDHLWCMYLSWISMMHVYMILDPDACMYDTFM